MPQNHFIGDQEIGTISINSHPLLIEVCSWRWLTTLIPQTTLVCTLGQKEEIQDLSQKVASVLETVSHSLPLREAEGYGAKHRQVQPSVTSSESCTLTSQLKLCLPTASHLASSAYIRTHKTTAQGSYSNCFGAKLTQQRVLRYGLLWKTGI